ncbi:tRNA (adenosine(37)-N6)-threonylcarbamoyltransferase complex dimerization subunit type 1 TsaB [Candidatus Bealeia paramacronuclearis]|uniref:tRNA (Adenosine(37)-N6)-threonylcarbamoyltransferase complex dimerization subunit type 1 TsaB n=1 Tax=Candidatus Bealeia paramacronuclearis TaxID=1921001 RepID=A0ABZ2C4A0_9PROT|nr:tRNA (adenosine(37)-N6)-threonylcarbamoyltransferase complex dimerization subunit type 1 TsaB [Candidatus Bealeia paramacronuclearis]
MNLFINTAHAICGVGLFHEKTLLAQKETALIQGHAQLLPGMVEEVMATTGTTFKDLQNLIVDVGPGSFTGIRVGVAFAKGLAHGLNIPLEGINGFDMFFQGKTNREDTLVVIDAKRKDLYCQFFPKNGNSSVPQNLSSHDIEEFYDLNEIKCIGDGATQLEKELGFSLNLIKSEMTFLELMNIAFLLGHSQSPAIPFYLRSADVSHPKN